MKPDGSLLCSQGQLMSRSIIENYIYFTTDKFKQTTGWEVLMFNEGG
jgi:hypothetical protein